MNQEEYYYDEIDLKEYVKVLLKWRGLIILILFLAVGGAGVYSWLSPEIYEVQTTLEIGQLRGELESPDQVVEKMTSHTYLNRLDREFLFNNLEVENPDKTRLIRIKTETSRPAEAKEVLDEVNELILSAHQEELERRQTKIESGIEELEAELEFVKTRKTYTEGIASLRLNIINLRNELADAVPTRIVKESVASEEPISPNLKLNLAVALVLGSFSGVFSAFAVEWWQKNF